LPEQTEDEVLLSFDEIVGVDVDDVAADGLRRVEGQRQVLVLRVHRRRLLVERALVDRVRARVVDHLAAGVRFTVQFRAGNFRINPIWSSLSL
jgi:hypothetical protein